MKQPLVLVLAVAPLLFGFCEGVTTDPREGGYFAGKCGLATGAYERRLQQRQAILGRLEAHHQSLEARVTAANRSRTELDSELAAADAKLQRDKAEIDALVRDLDPRSSRRLAKRAEVDKLKAEQVALKAEFERLYAKEADAQLAMRRLRDGLAEARSRDEIQERAHEAANSEAVVHGMVTDLRRRLAR